MSDPECLIVMSTIDDAVQARRVADRVVEAGLAACVNILPGVTSVFRWEPDSGDPARAGVQAEGEVLLLIKTTAAAYDALEQLLQREHTYELPEVVALPMTRGLPGFLRWIGASTSS